MSEALQNILTTLIVLMAFGFLFHRAYKKHLAEPFAKLLLKMGQVKWAMWVRGQSKPGCNDCR